ncbi:hypothetical protein [Leucobacter japonicus]|uniref:hypothetical protein n=1 Tax=Leucobacter japonicus TaxID=1461259 RepID=UPI0006A7D25E|nr:hypothetical protein [Leucobacter japonicus]
MDWAMLWIQIGIFVATAGSAAVAWWKANESSDDAKAAAEALESISSSASLSAEHSGRQADALELANVISASVAKPKRWSEPEWIKFEGVNVREIINLTDEVVTIVGMRLHPEGRGGFVGFVGEARRAPESGFDIPNPPFEVVPRGRVRFIQAGKDGPYFEAMQILSRTKDDIEDGSDWFSLDL